ncbi:hypothetical protein I7I51_04537 [Histoplasma capsulatum]|uniref:Uncharacterized protein n=2 Tax=Histoplasma TaxID=5036 RepID=A0A8A1M8Q5_AJECA|nr:hypothetical protein I7I51_04537 [Histoplasma capsulatum]
MPENIQSEIDQLPLAAVTRSMSRSVVDDGEQPSVEPRTKDATWINFNSTTRPSATQPKTQKPTRKRRKADSLTAVQLNGTPSIEFTGNSDGRPNKLDEIAWLVTELKGIIAQQGQAVETLKTCCEELKADQKELIRQNSSLKDEITALRAQRFDPKKRICAGEGLSYKYLGLYQDSTDEPEADEYSEILDYHNVDQPQEITDLSFNLDRAASMCSG